MAIKILVVDDEPDIQHLFPQEFRSEIRRRWIFACPLIFQKATMEM